MAEIPSDLSDPRYQEQKARLYGFVKEAFESRGFPGVPEADLRQATDRVERELTQPGNTQPVAAVIDIGISAVLAGKTPEQMEALRQPPKSEAAELKDNVKPFFDLAGNTPVGRLASGGNPAFRANNYDSMAGDKYDRNRGVASLSSENFATSPFAQAGMGVADIATIKMLAASGFGTEAIITAGRDRSGLELSGAKSLENLAHIRKASPKLIGSLHEYKSHAAQGARDYADAQKEAEEAEREGRKDDARKARERMAKIEEEQRKERERRAAEAPDPDTRRRVQEEEEKIWAAQKKKMIEAKNGDCQEFRVWAGGLNIVRPSLW